ncbi:hypothetical protein J2T57_001464 [Natronocella acetinitrilica]|uniref:Uncharacterized protein n=1 Tax=Natronocella acetinitrilica TaxID=414046 RepID=A0AAE3KFR7_9GAMM|nr:hypothetical protein [Natronocella acetinitrilica]MCP1674362.1 hypothetical protein [Natronocella acetinitrilica]
MRSAFRLPIRIAPLLLAATLIAPASHSAANQGFAYCKMSYSGVAYYSAIFEHDRSTYRAPSMILHFGDHVRARYDNAGRSLVSGPDCYQTFRSYGEAESNKNSSMTHDRRLRWDSVLTGWRWQGR